MAIREEASFSEAFPSMKIPDKFALHDEFMTPLQPLADNISSSLYFAMEMDRSKYAAYHSAIRDAFLTLEASPNVMIMGAGRGPLVESVLYWATELSVKVERIIVVEKNPNAFAT